MIVQRLLADNQYTLRTTFYVDETAATVGTVTVTVRDLDGATVATGAATEVSAGVYEYVLPPQAQLNLLTATWASPTRSIVMPIEIVRDFWFDIPDLRAQPSLADPGAYPTAKLRDVRTQVEEAIERVLGFACVPRFGRALVDGRGSDTVFLPHRLLRTVRAVRVGGQAVAGTYVPHPGGFIMTPYTVTAGTLNVQVDYEHGLDRPPADLRGAALKLAREVALDTKSQAWDRAATISNEAGTFTLAQADDRQRPFGIPDVDSVVVRHRRKTPFVV